MAFSNAERSAFQFEGSRRESSAAHQAERTPEPEAGLERPQPQPTFFLGEGRVASLVTCRTSSAGAGAATGAGAAEARAGVMALAGELSGLNCGSDSSVPSASAEVGAAAGAAAGHAGGQRGGREGACSARLGKAAKGRREDGDRMAPV